MGVTEIDQVTRHRKYSFNIMLCCIRQHVKQMSQIIKACVLGILSTYCIKNTL